ncbi:hypothetical protein [Streptomyces sp. NPDC005077]
MEPDTDDLWRFVIVALAVYFALPNAASVGPGVRGIGHAHFIGGRGCG